MARYEYETSPRKVVPSPKIDKPKVKTTTPSKKTTTTKKEPAKGPPKSAESKNKTSAKTKSKKSTLKKRKEKVQKIKLTAYIVIGFFVAFAVSYRHSLINENFNKLQGLKKDLSVLEQENGQLKVIIESSLNLKNIEQIAKDELGMKKSEETEKVYVTLPKKDYIEPATEEVKLNKEKNIIQIILEWIEGI